MGFQPTLEPEAQGLLSEMQAVSDVRDQMASMRNEQFQASNLALDFAGMGSPGLMSNVIMPAAQRAITPERIQNSARESRKLVYAELKSRFPKGVEGLGTDLKNSIKNGWNFITGSESQNVLNKREHLQQYKEAVKEITSVPDFLMGRLKRVTNVSDAAGNFGDATMGLANNFGQGVISHEIAGHNATETISNLVARGQRQPGILENLRKLPDKSQEVLKSQFIMEQMDKQHIRFNKSEPTFYKKNYKQWPSEIYSNGIETKMKDWVNINNARPTYRQYLDEIASEPAQQAITKMKKKFPAEYKAGEKIWNEYYKPAIDATY
jgi:hypothetical protein